MGKQHDIMIGKGESNDYPIHKPFYNFFKETVATCPYAPAIRQEDIRITYEELMRRVDHFSCVLHQKGVRSGDHVGVYCIPSIELMVAVLAILKCGACYVPLDVSYPKDRLMHLIQNSEVSLILYNHDNELLNSIKKLKRLVLLNLLEATEMISAEVEVEFPIIHPESPAYLIYTSGTSGVPKGICVSHRALNNHMLWMKNTFNFNANDKILFKTPITFDPSIWEIFLASYCGAEVCIAPLSAFKNPGKLIELVNHYQITTLQLVPIILYQLLQQPSVITCRSLSRLFVGGESLSRQIKSTFFKKISAELINLYGPAEATIDITYHRIKRTEYDLIHNIIGRPIANNHLFVLDGQEKLCKAGESGELCISGSSLALGYYNNETLTAKAFVKNPYLDGEMMYKTGDIVRWLPDGNLEYIGRNDSQLKINGVRIEPDSIISYILQDKQIQNAYILKETNEKGHSFIVCYLVPVENTTIHIKKIHRYLMLHFPSYILPKKYYLIKSEPLSPNGKLDIAHLSDQAILLQKTKQIRRIKNATIERLQEIWGSILGIEVVEPQQNFFDLGGDSLSALRLQDEIYAGFGVSLRLEELAVTATVIEQAKVVNQKINKKGINKNTNHEYIIALNNNSQKKINLFLIHPIGGTIFWFVPLARALESVCQVYAIQDPEITDPTLNFNSIQEMAALYADSIKKIQPNGPYFLGGASFGATVAIEVANIYSLHHEKIGALFNFDGWGHYPETLKDEEFFTQLMKAQQLEWSKKFNASHYSILVDKLFDVQWKRINLLYDYKMRPFLHPMILFKANKLMDYFKEIDDCTNHWSKYSQNLKTILVPGNHETLFNENNISTIIKTIRQILFPNDVLDLVISD